MDYGDKLPPSPQYTFYAAAPVHFYAAVDSGMNTLALQVQEDLEHDPHGGDLYIFRGRRGDLVKCLWHDGVGISLYAKRLERGRFLATTFPYSGHMFRTWYGLFLRRPRFFHQALRHSASL